MARKRDYKAEYRAKLEREQRRGFSGEREATRYRKLGITERPYEQRDRKYDEVRELGHHSEKGSFWGHSVREFDTLHDANEFASDIWRGDLDKNEFLGKGEDVGKIARIWVEVSEDGDAWVVMIELYVEY